MKSLEKNNNKKKIINIEEELKNLERRIKAKIKKNKPKREIKKI